MLQQVRDPPLWVVAPPLVPRVGGVIPECFKKGLKIQTCVSLVTVLFSSIFFDRVKTNFPCWEEDQGQYRNAACPCCSSEILHVHPAKRRPALLFVPPEQSCI